MCRNYFKDWSVHFQQKLPDQKALLCFHPHGVMCFGMTVITHMGSSLSVNYFLVSRCLLSLPISGMFVRLLGAQSVDQNNLSKQLATGQNIGIVPGGFEESSLLAYDKSRVFIKKRKGFIKYALKYGYTVYPVYVFGENRLYYTLDGWLKFKLFLNKFKLPALLFISKQFILPSKDAELRACVGKGIPLPEIKNPNKEDISRYHDLYVQELTNVYDKYKKDFCNNQDLEIY